MQTTKIICDEDNREANIEGDAEGSWFNSDPIRMTPQLAREMAANLIKWAEAQEKGG